MTKPINVEGIEKATGKSWDDWVAFLDSRGGRDMSHPDIAKLAYDHIVQSGVFDDSTANSMGKQNSSGWWSQSVTVAYEQHIGRRAPGQRADGTFEVSVTKTLAGDIDQAMQWWMSNIADMDEFDGLRVDGVAKTSSTPKYRHWRVNLTDGTRVIAATSGKATDKSLLSIAHQKLASSKDAEKWRSFWKQFLLER